MRITVKVFAIAGLICGGLALVGSMDSGDIASLIGGLWFIAWGICDLVFLDSIKK
jgi:hypothetical protein